MYDMHVHVDVYIHVCMTVQCVVIILLYQVCGGCLYKYGYTSTCDQVSGQRIWIHLPLDAICVHEFIHVCCRVFLCIDQRIVCACMCGFIWKMFKEGGGESKQRLKFPFRGEGSKHSTHIYKVL